MEQVMKVEEIGQSKQQVSHLAMTVALVSWTMLFATLFLGYTVFRFSSPVWPPLGTPTISLHLPMMSTLAIIFSSVALILAERNFQKLQHKNFQFFLTVATVLGLTFMFIQKMFWNELIERGLYVQSGVYASIMHGFTWIHAGHVVLGILGLMWLMSIAFFKENWANYIATVNQLSKFWHFLGIIWIVMFIVLFCL